MRDRFCRLAPGGAAHFSLSPSRGEGWGEGRSAPLRTCADAMSCCKPLSPERGEGTRRSPPPSPGVAGEAEKSCPAIRGASGPLIRTTILAHGPAALLLIAAIVSPV